ncbi:MAG: HAMP domain-containing sensor histidine kinase [Eubacteriales bacterium]|nr:HAMP domain-containing sensor histidine kinase [Eubacteriales bacterium]
MEKRTVKRRIFLSNALMVVVTLFIFLIINLFVIKFYAESIEAEFQASVEGVMDEDGLDDLLEDWTVHRNEFILIFGADGILCIIVLLVISQLFTKNLTDHIMEPLDALAEGAKRIRKNDLTQDIAYTGELEFENVCAAFNDMQASILAEQEKNRKYEKARTDMIAGISHDLRTPLTAMKGTIKGLIDGVASAPEQQKKFLQAAYRRTGDMDMLLNQLLYLSRMETGNMPISMQTVEIAAFLKNYTLSRSARFEEACIRQRPDGYVKGKQEVRDDLQEEITADTQGITAKVSIDTEQFQRILDNLMENSRKYGETTPLRMTIKLEKTPKGISVCFQDNGVGVPEEKLPYIFDEFYRGDESRNKKEGNGLGLYIVKYLMEAMGGSVRAENADGLAVYLELREV